MVNTFVRSSFRYRGRMPNLVYGIHIQLIPKGLLKRWGIFLEIFLH